jgi:hypothetical protein
MTPTTCVTCHTQLRPARRPDLPGKPHKARGLCTACYTRQTRDPERTRPYRRCRPRADAVEDYLWLRDTDTYQRIAARLGYNPATLECALRLAGITGIPDHRTLR